MTLRQPAFFSTRKLAVLSIHTHSKVERREDEFESATENSGSYAACLRVCGGVRPEVLPLVFRSMWEHSDPGDREPSVHLVDHVSGAQLATPTTGWTPARPLGLGPGAFTSDISREGAALGGARSDVSTSTKGAVSVGVLMLDVLGRREPRPHAKTSSAGDRLETDRPHLNACRPVYYSETDHP